MKGFFLASQEVEGAKDEKAKRKGKERRAKKLGS
jgi:hypothetical protein